MVHNLRSLSSGRNAPSMNSAPSTVSSHPSSACASALTSPKNAWSAGWIAASCPATEPGRDRPAHLRARIFLDQRAAGDGELGLVGPVAKEFALSSDQDRAGFGMAKR